MSGSIIELQKWDCTYVMACPLICRPFLTHILLWISERLAYQMWKKRKIIFILLYFIIVDKHIIYWQHVIIFIFWKYILILSYTVFAADLHQDWNLSKYLFFLVPNIIYTLSQESSNISKFLFMLWFNDCHLQLLE